VAQAALQTYHALRLRAKDPKNADLAGHVEHLRRILGRREAAKRGKKKAGKEGE
jgi:ATP adenylyltransferase/5',5'''-P-1,P-4-tetraphosphate phosphorylase II